MSGKNLKKYFIFKSTFLKSNIFQHALREKDPFIRVQTNCKMRIMVQAFRKIHFNIPHGRSEVGIRIASSMSFQMVPNVYCLFVQVLNCVKPCVRIKGLNRIQHVLLIFQYVLFIDCNGFIFAFFLETRSNTLASSIYNWTTTVQYSSTNAAIENQTKELKTNQSGNFFL